MQARKHASEGIHPGFEVGNVGIVVFQGVCEKRYCDTRIVSYSALRPKSM